MNITTRNPSMDTTFERLSALLVKDHKVDPARLHPDAPLDSLGIDSLGAVELFWQVEDRFGIKLPADPVDLKTLGDVVRQVDALVEAQPGVQTAAAQPAGATTLSPSP
jgi:acyl carrier protein